MPDINDSDTHPSAVSEADRERMTKLVEEDTGELEAGAAGDGEGDGGDQGTPEGEGAGADADGDASGDASGDKQGAEAGEATAGDAGGESTGEGQGDGDGSGAARKEDTVSRQQFDGVLSELRDTRRVVQALRGPKLDPLPPRDFEAEDKVLDDAEAALDAKFDEDPNFTDADYRLEMRDINRKRRDLDRDRGRYEMRAEQEQAANAANEVLVKQQQDEWDTMVAEWQEGLGDWIKNPARRNNVNATMAAMMQDPEDSKLDNAAFLSKLEAYLADEYPTFPKREGGEMNRQQNNVEPRRKLAAARAAEASGGPPRMQGGTGNRATATPVVELKGMKLGKFKDLPKAVQDKALGLTDTD